MGMPTSRINAKNLFGMLFAAFFIFYTQVAVQAYFSLRTSVTLAAILFTSISQERSGGGKIENNPISFHPLPLPLATLKQHGGLRTPVLVIFDIWWKFLIL